jgi:formate hydrogenlyase subunit 6/NADH:ubiquinone oxidoreductase subunit I
MPYAINDKCIGCSVCKKVCPTDAITGTRGKVHKVAADLCIDCGACGLVCPQEAVLDFSGKTCRRVRFKARWEKPVIDREKCVSCLACVEACPMDCLDWTWTPDTVNRRAYPALNPQVTCIACGFCARECPVDAIVMAAAK